MVEFDDLTEEQVTDLPSLKIADSTKFSEGLIPVVTKVRKRELWSLISWALRYIHENAVGIDSKRSQSGARTSNISFIQSATHCNVTQQPLHKKTRT